MKKVLFVILQCTWGIVQTLIGAVIFLIMMRCPHELYRGCVHTRWDKQSGLSLGLFIFTPRDGKGYSERIRVHEYGHCVQSAVLGPFYLLVGLVSFVWARFPYFVRLRKEKGIPYAKCFVESWANKWGETLTGEKAI